MEISSLRIFALVGSCRSAGNTARTARTRSGLRRRSCQVRKFTASWLKEERPLSDGTLVAYATQYGSTREVAEKIADTLREAGSVLELQSTGRVRARDGYRATAVDAPLYMFNWLKEQRTFLARHRTTLERVPGAVFALGPTEDKEKDWQETRGQLDKVLARYPWLNPVAIRLFDGKFDASRLTFP